MRVSILFIMTLMYSLSSIANTEIVKTGGIKLIELENGFKVWTKQVKGGSIPILTLHGPGCTHECFECFEDFLPQAGYQIIYYDQLGSYYSDQPTDPALWNLERFCDEVEQVRKALGLEHFYLYGQSWGGLLAMEYALHHQEHLKGLIISNMAGSVESYINYLGQLRLQLPQEIQNTLKYYEDKEEYTAPEYQKIMFDTIYSQHLCRVNPLPDPVQRMFKHLNTQVYNSMQGPNEFMMIGNLKDWNRWDYLSRITVPTLLMGARYDTMNPEDIRKMGMLISRSRVSICDNGSHLALYDDQETYFKDLLCFLNDVESGSI